MRGQPQTLHAKVRGPPFFTRSLFLNSQSQSLPLYSLSLFLSVFIVFASRKLKWQELHERKARMMDWKNQQQVEEQENVVNGMGGMFVKVMTDEQLELLRRQISVYSTICEQLVQMHKSISAQHDLSGMRLGNLYCEPFMASSGHKITSRQRWTPTPVQLQILESIFDQGSGTPNKQRITEITSELAQHGQISETNVYNWFQNRRARSKRRQSVPVPNNAESELETEVESPKEEKTKPENIQSHENSAPRTESMCFHSSPEIGTEMLCLDFDAQPSQVEPIFPSYCGLRSSGSLGHMMSVIPNPRLDQLIHKMEVPESFSPYSLGEGYSMDG